MHACVRECVERERTGGREGGREKICVCVRRERERERERDLVSKREIHIQKAPRMPPPKK